MTPDTLRIALVSPRNDPDIDARLTTSDRMLADAAGDGAAIACFPETYIPGLRGQDFDVPPPDQARQQDAMDAIRASCARHGIAAIVGMEWRTSLGLHNVAFVIGRDGEVEGY